MTTEEVRGGGLEVGAPSKVPPIGVDLTEEQQLAIAFRHLADIGFAENIAGHITWQPDGRSDMFVNPWGLWWQEFTASTSASSTRTRGWSADAGTSRPPFTSTPNCTGNGPTPEW